MREGKFCERVNMRVVIESGTVRCFQYREGRCKAANGPCLLRRVEEPTNGRRAIYG